MQFSFIPSKQLYPTALLITSLIKKITFPINSHYLDAFLLNNQKHQHPVGSFS